MVPCNKDQRFPAAQLTVTVAWGHWWGARVQGVIGGLGEVLGGTWHRDMEKC